MIDLYTWTTPNGRKVSILLEELGVPYRVHPVNIDKGEQHAPAFTAIAPNNKIPAIVDRDADDFALMESGAILLYLAEKHGRFLPAGVERWRTIEWLMWQMGGIGPIAGQAHHFLRNNSGKSPYSEDRFGREVQRLYRVLDARLEGRDYVAGAGRGEYTVADMAIWPWVSRFEWHRADLAAYPRVCDWYLGIAGRPAVQRGYQVPRNVGPIPTPA